MSTAAYTAQISSGPPPDDDADQRRTRRRRFALYAALGFVVLCVVRVVTGADQVTSSGTLTVALTATMPIALAGLGGLWSERAGIVNIGLEGQMIMGTLGAGYFGFHYGVVVGVLGAIVFGILGGLLHAFATVIVGVDHIVSGVAINIIAAGVSGFLAETWFSDLEGGGPTQSPPLPTPPEIDISFIADPANTLEEKHWFLISDLAGVVEMFTKNLSSLTLVGLVLIFGTIWLLWSTRFGLRLRSCGESPVAAESLGINVIRYKFLACLISGGLAGLAGGYLAMVSSSGFQVGQTNGRGYIGLAAMIFGNWRPVGLVPGLDPVRLHPGAAVPRRDRTRCTPCCSSSRSSSSSWRCSSWSAAGGGRPPRRRSSRCSSSSGTSPPSRAQRLHHHGAVRHDAAGAGARVATTTHARG